MKLTVDQIKDLYERVTSNGSVSQVEINEGEDGRIQFYVVEIKEIRRPLRKPAKKQETE